jgi:hypothetical protein
MEELLQIIFQLTIHILATKVQQLTVALCKVLGLDQLPQHVNKIHLNVVDYLQPSYGDPAKLIQMLKTLSTPTTPHIPLVIQLLAIGLDQELALPHGNVIMATGQ